MSGEMGDQSTTQSMNYSMNCSISGYMSPIDRYSIKMTAPNIKMDRKGIDRKKLLIVDD
jgi:hypothetical protein